jgi:hypothetical protein
MKIITEGHKYELESFEGRNPQVIQFIEKVSAEEYQSLNPFAVVNNGTQLYTINDGTTNEELLAVLIDRLTFLNNKFPCRQNALAITKLQEAEFWLENRTKERLKRGVEGKHEK